MRLPALALLIVALAACETAPAPAPEIEPPPAASSPEIANLPDYKPETAAACNAVPMRVNVAANGALTVNGEASNMAGLQAAAHRKNDACRNAPAMVFFNAPANLPATTREATLNALGQIIVNIGIIETSN